MVRQNLAIKQEEMIVRVICFGTCAVLIISSVSYASEQEICTTGLELTARPPITVYEGPPVGAKVCVTTDDTTAVIDVWAGHNFDLVRLTTKEDSAEGAHMSCWSGKATRIDFASGDFDTSAKVCVRIEMHGI